MNPLELGTDARPVAPPYKILTAVAFDLTAEAVLLEGMGLAARHPGSELHVVHVAREPKPVDTTLSLVPTQDAPEKPADILRRRVELGWKTAGPISVVSHIRSGDPAQAILQAAIDIGADVIVVGSHRRTGLEKLVLGSVAEQVLHAAHCPILIVVTRDYAGTVASPSVAPPCPECLAARAASGNVRFWCERHSRSYMPPHVYVPRAEPRASAFPGL